MKIVKYVIRMFKGVEHNRFPVPRNRFSTNRDARTLLVDHVLVVIYKLIKMG